MAAIDANFGTNQEAGSRRIGNVAVLRSSGERQTGWEVLGVVGEDRVCVSAAGLLKDVLVADLLKANPVLLAGQTLRIRRSSGAFESDWAVVCLRDDGDVHVVRQGQEKRVALDRVVEWNDWGTQFGRAA